MTEHFLVKCFLIGVSAASGVGPVFLFTLNQSTRHGFFKGFAAALGSALADSLYFLLATFGFLSFIESLRGALLLMEGGSGLALVIFGIHLFRSKTDAQKNTAHSNQSLFSAMLKSIFLTLLNPFLFLFFVFASVHMLPQETLNLSHEALLFGSFVVGCGSLLVLTLVAGFGALVGGKIKASTLDALNKVIGVIFGGIGIYLLADFIMKFFKLSM